MTILLSAENAGLRSWRSGNFVKPYDKYRVLCGISRPVVIISGFGIGTVFGPKVFSKIIPGGGNPQPDNEYYIMDVKMCCL
jgi:hypothetical protein